MYIGFHISKTRGYLQALLDAMDVGANSFQIMTGSPQKINFPLKNLTEKDFEDFKEIKKYKDFKVYIHTPYIMNLCNPDKIGLNTKIILEDLTICNYMGGIGVVVHTGNRMKEQSLENSIKTYIKTIKNVLKRYKSNAKILIETSAGQGNSIGVNIRDFAYIFNSFTKAEKKYLGLCIDTCHIYVAGYDITTKNGMVNYLIELNKYIDLQNIELIHLNDSKFTLGEKKDRHENIGKGFIFNKSLESIEILKGLNIPIILETPDKIYPYDTFKNEINIVKNLKSDKENYELRKKEIEDKELIIKYFSELSEIYQKLGEKYKADAYYEVIYRLKYIHRLPDTKKELMKIEGIGDSISDKILEILKTKKLKYLEDMKQNKKLNIIIQLLNIYGIGAKKALELYDLGIHSYNDLQKAITIGDIKLTKDQQLGFYHYKDLVKQIPRKEIEKLERYITNNTNKTKINDVYEPKLRLVGSYRRGKSKMNDIDLLGVNITIDKVIKLLEKKYQVIDFITKGINKSSFLIIIDKIVRKIDLLITTPTSYYPALMYFTGSKYFNIEMRTIAKEKGYKLNEFNLTKGSRKIPINSEKDIFDKLNMFYVEPTNR